MIPKVTFSNGIWARFQDTLLNAFFRQSNLRYNFGLGFRDVKEVCLYWNEPKTFFALNDILEKNNLINKIDEFNTVSRIVKWVNSTYPSSVFYIKDGSKDVWNHPLDTLESFNIRKNLIKSNPKSNIASLKLTKEWKNCLSTDCDDYAILIYNLLRVANVDKKRLFISFVSTISKGKDAWHMNVMYFSDGIPYALEGTYNPEKTMSVFGKTPYFNISYYKLVNWIWNEDDLLKCTDKLKKLVDI